MPQSDKIVIICANPKFAASWINAIKTIAPQRKVEVYPEDTRREETEFIIAFKPPEGVFKHYPNLKVIASMAAGVRHITQDPTLPQNVKVTKANDPLHKRDMALFTLGLVLNHTKSLYRYTLQKGQKLWQPHKYIRPEDITIGIMGIGAIGQAIGQALVKNGFRVSGWSRSPKTLTDIKTFYGDDQRNAFLQSANILICTLPLTNETTGILNASVFEQMPTKAYLINVGRGAQLVEKDLLHALHTGQLSGTALDVFEEEPLPKDHPFWEHDEIMITPHAAGITDPQSMVQGVLDNYKAMKNNEELKDVVDLSKGY